MQPMSPKKYIETKARSLPMHKCYVNENWQEAAIVNLLVCRRHVNNNITGAFYLVDLKCLGVKDTFWFFNESEAYIQNKIFKNAPGKFETIDYHLAHNIVFAGHDFAMDYDIHPHKEFATTRFILEADDDNIPLIDVAVGEGPEAKPHLMTYGMNEHLDALAKLRKNAGEGNYHYTVMNMDRFMDKDDFLDNDGDEGEEEETRLADLPPNGLNFSVLPDLSMEDLMDAALLKTRNQFEIIIARVEVLLRLNVEAGPGTVDYTEPHAITEAGYILLDNPSEYPHGMTNNDYIAGQPLVEAYTNELEQEGLSDEVKLAILANHLTMAKSNPYFLQLGFESCMKEPNAVNLILPYVEPNKQLPIFRLLLAFYRLLNDLRLDDSEAIVNSVSLADTFSAKDGFDSNELTIFHTIQTLRHTRNGNMASATAHYDLLTSTEYPEMHIFLLMNLFAEFLPALEKYVLERIGKV
ncbi:MAG: hypothetical protein ABIX01_00185 [Chitinophagaceae bacterium]